MEQPLLAEILKLNPEERFDLLGEVWDSLIQDPARIPVTPEQKRELDHRLERAAKANTEWGDLRKRLEGKK